MKLRNLFLVGMFCFLSLSGCAGEQLKRCTGPVVDKTKMSCPSQVHGMYRMCVPAVDMFEGCETPQ